MIKEIKEIKKVIRAEAEKLRINAGSNGSHSDGGASSLENELNFFLFGMCSEKSNTEYDYINSVLQDDGDLKISVRVPQDWIKFWNK